MDEYGVVSFTGTIHLLRDGHLKVFDNNVQIITSNHLDTVYIIFTENEEHLPEMFDPRSYNFSYAKREGLRITPVDESRKMIVSIYPRPA
ncbi:hypothetical protein EGI32_15670 [Ferruginibacter sp. HRS2-29]|nr:hypothetical protein [Ferruginibacter sp. HRS2-29]